MRPYGPALAFITPGRASSSSTWAWNGMERLVVVGPVVAYLREKPGPVDTFSCFTIPPSNPATIRHVETHVKLAAFPLRLSQSHVM